MEKKKKEEDNLVIFRFIMKTKEKLNITLRCLFFSFLFFFNNFEIAQHF